VRIVAPDSLKAEPLIKPIGSLVLKATETNYLLALRVEASDCVLQNSTANSPAFDNLVVSGSRQLQPHQAGQPANYWSAYPAMLGQ
jgi:hypothetical protein